MRINEVTSPEKPWRSPVGSGSAEAKPMPSVSLVTVQAATGLPAASSIRPVTKWVSPAHRRTKAGRTAIAAVSSPRAMCVIPTGTAATASSERSPRTRAIVTASCPNLKGLGVVAADQALIPHEDGYAPEPTLVTQRPAQHLRLMEMLAHPH